MSWVGPLAKNAVKYGARYGPHAKVAWEAGGKQVQAAARAKLDELTQQRKAFDQAESTLDGAVLRVVHQGDPVFVVLSGEDPVASYPDVATPLEELIRRADLGKRRTADQFHEQQLRTRARKAGAAARARVRPRRRPDPPELGSTDD